MSRRSLATALILPSILILASACGSTLLRGPSGPSQTDVDGLKRQLVEMRRQHVVDEVEIGRLRQEVERLEKNVADAEQRIASRRAVEARPVAPIARPSIESRDLEETTLPPVAVMPTPAPRAAEPPPSIGTPRPQALPPQQPGPVSEANQALYDRGYTLFHQQQYGDAEARFEEFLAGAPQSDLSDNAQFWIGECRYAQNDFRGALAAFTATVDRYPRGNKVPDAMVKAGRSLEALGDLTAAIETYREVTTRFPGTAASAIAEEHLAELR